MSLELAIQQNTAAINTLIEILSKGTIPTAPAAEEVAPGFGTAVTDAAKAVAAETKARRTKKEAKPEAPAGEPAQEASAPAPEIGATAASEMEVAAAPAKQITYTEASAAVVKVANTKGRQVAVEILAKFGAKTLGEVKASSYAKVIEACEAAL
jgi:hypothetical protein